MHHFAPEMQGAVAMPSRPEVSLLTPGHGRVSSRHHFSTAHAPWDPSGSSRPKATLAGGNPPPNALNSITKTVSRTMKSPSHFRSLGGVALFAAVVSAATAFGGTVSHGNFSTSKVSFRDVTESGADIPPGLFIPPTPTLLETGNRSELSFFPNRFVLTDQSFAFQLKSLSSQLGMFVAGKTVLSGSGGATAYELTSLTLNVKGAYELYAPFSNIPPSGATSVAQAQMSNVPLTIKVTGVNWESYAGGIALGTEIAVTPSTQTVSGPNGSASGIWSGSYSVDWAALRVQAGIQPTDYITEIQIQATPAVHAASMFASAQASVTNFDVQTNTAPVAVPEPPTIILAGLGAAAAVGHGYRRRKLRHRDGEGSDGEWNDEEGAIALTA